ncbi:MAG: hypothetical protein ACKVII_14545 [Planctomycetales bacterium]
MSSFVRKSLLLALVAACGGCSNWPLSSKWAMDDVDYSAKYSQPYGDDKPIRMLKQMFDARHVEGKSGVFAGGGGGGAPSTGGASIGGFVYPNYWTEVDLALTGLAGTGAHDWFIGPEAGIRFQTPTRIAPFAGAGAFLGGNRYRSPAEDDGEDNDDDGSIDELGERKTEYKAFVAVYPEVGIHAWLTGTTRLTASARYYVTEEGRKDDFWYVGLALGWNLGGGAGGETIEVFERTEPDVPTDEQLRQAIDEANEPARNRPIDQTGLQLGPDVE